MSNRSSARHKLSVPRSTDEIKRELSQLAFQYGNTQYQVMVLQDEQQQLTERMKAVTKEAKNRIKLDEERAKEAKARVTLPEAGNE